MNARLKQSVVAKSLSQICLECKITKHRVMNMYNIQNIFTQSCPMRAPGL